ncbi:MAG: hypothetical protein J6B50_04875 [Lachnospiraceae bacterium]|nr:hypothetical protein [Lachnospiraceae bacterium]MBP3506537.1 hypothetical protein [Lachnospiraceae bacterium]
MTYNQFLNYVREQSIYELEHPEEYQATINHVVKNNSVELDGICLHKHGENLSPTVYLNQFYEQYLEGRPLKSILGEIVSTLNNDVPKLEIPASLYDDYEAIRPQIIYRIVNYEKNKDLLKTCPYLPFCDLAITFRWLVHADSYGIASSLITNRELDLWNITVEELFKVACRNTQRFFPPVIQPMQELLREYAHEDKELQALYQAAPPTFQIYILTNKSRINGSTCMIYDNVLANFAKQQESDIYILPSSIHEVLLIPARYGIDEHDLLSLVHDANRTVVAVTDVLSDSIYRYDYSRNRVIMIQNNWHGNWS